MGDDGEESEGLVIVEVADDLTVREHISGNC
jgi:hypothetical protein